MKPGLAAVGSATVAVLSQSSSGVTWYRPTYCALYMLLVIVQTVPWLLLLYIVREYIII